MADADHPLLAKNDPGYRRFLFALFLGGLATFAQLYAVQSILPLISYDMQITESDAALVISVGTAGIAVGILPWAILSIRFGRARVIKIAIIASSVIGLAAPFLPTWPLILAARFVDGLALAAIPALAFALIAERMTSRWVAVVAGSYVAGNTIGGLSGRLIAAAIGEVSNWRLALLGVSAVCLLASIAFLFALRTNGSHLTSSEQPRHFISNTVHVLKDRRLWGMYLQPFLLMGAFVSIYSYLPFRLLASPFGLPLAATSSLFLVYLAGTVSSRLSGSAVARFGNHAVLITATIVMAGGTLLMVVDNIVAVAIGLAIFTAGYFGVSPASNSWTVGIAGPHKSQATAIYQLSYYAGSGMISWLLGLTFGVGGWTILTFAVGTCCVLAIAASFLTSTTESPTSQTAV